jgi:hypothetical protein
MTTCVENKKNKRERERSIYSLTLTEVMWEEKWTQKGLALIEEEALEHGSATSEQVTAEKSLDASFLQ